MSFRDVFVIDGRGRQAGEGRGDGDAFLMFGGMFTQPCGQDTFREPRRRFALRCDPDGTRVE